MFDHAMKTAVASLVACIVLGMSFATSAAKQNALSCDTQILEFELTVTDDNSVTKTSDALTGSCDAFDTILKMGNVIDDTDAEVKYSYFEVTSTGDVEAIDTGLVCDGNGNGDNGGISGENCGKRYDAGVDSGSKIRVKVEDTDCPLDGQDCGTAQFQLASVSTSDSD